jgi:predicted amidohydrolase
MPVREAGFGSSTIRSLFGDLDPEGDEAMNLSRREVLIGAAALAATPAFAQEKPAVQRATLAQIPVTRKVAENLQRMRAAFEQAKKDKAGWIVFPEGALSGYHGAFNPKEVEEAFVEVRQLCKDAGVVGLIGTCWKEEAEKPHNQIRIVDKSGELVGRYAKTCLTYGDAKDYTAGGFPIVHTAGGIKFGTLICNDLWVTPGFTDGPNPSLTLQMAKAGAQAIFHAVNSGTDTWFRGYHESNLALRAAEAKCPIVVVNAASDKGEVNAASGVVTAFEYVKMLPRKGEAVETVEFSPRAP